MLDIGIFAPFGTDHERNTAFCRDTDVRHLVLSTGQVGGNDVAPSGAGLKELVSKYADEGIRLMALTPPRIPQLAFGDAGARHEAVANMGELLQNMGKAGIPLVHMYLNIDELSEEDERQRLWEGLVQVYRELAAVAEEAGVRISTHHYHLPSRLLWNYETMAGLLREAESSASGVTYCQGKSQMAGDDLVDDIRRYGEKIFMFHVRDVATRTTGPVAPEVERRLADIGYLEVALGTGEVDMIGCFRALKEIGYQGQLYPEHYPAIAGDSAAGLAWTIGYMRALDRAV